MNEVITELTAQLRAELSELAPKERLEVLKPLILDLEQEATIAEYEVDEEAGA